jgi:hypothetical protein
MEHDDSVEITQGRKAPASLRAKSAIGPSRKQLRSIGKLADLFGFKRGFRNREAGNPFRF